MSSSAGLITPVRNPRPAGSQTPSPVQQAYAKLHTPKTPTMSSRSRLSPTAASFIPQPVRSPSDFRDFANALSRIGIRLSLNGPGWIDKKCDHMKYHPQFVVHLLIARTQHWRSLGMYYDWRTPIEEVNFVPLGHMDHPERARVLWGFGPDLDLGVAREMILRSKEMARSNGAILALRRGRKCYIGRGGLDVAPWLPK
jgi:hypothetical protein